LRKKREIQAKAMRLHAGKWKWENSAKKSQPKRLSRDFHGFDTESFTFTEIFSSSVLVVHDLHKRNQKQNRQTNTNQISETF